MNTMLADLRDMATRWWPAVVFIIGAVGGLVRVAWKRYRQSPGSEQLRFGGYISGSIKLRIGQRFSPILAKQLALRTYANRYLAVFPSKMLVPSVGSISIDIDSAYVRLSLSSRDTRTEDVYDSQLLEQRGRAFLIIGDPGSGKSSLTKKLFRDACRAAVVAPSRSRLPIHIELRTMVWDEAPPSPKEAAGKWLIEQIAAQVARVEALHDPQFVFRAFADGAGLVVFLDGLDEVPAESLSLATRALGQASISLMARSRHTAIFVTSRSQLWTSLTRSFIQGFQEIFRVEPFSPTDIFTFLRKWPFAVNWVDEASRIFSDLRRHPTLAEMCSNPLILAMYLAHDQQYPSAPGTTSVRLPETRPQFYAQVIGELLLYRRDEQSGMRTPLGTQVRRNREHALGKISLEHLLRGSENANSIPWDAAIDVVQETFRIDDRDQAEIALRRLAVDTGIFSEERAGERIRFHHLSICEFLAATELVEAPGDYMDQVLAQIAANDHATSDHATSDHEDAVPSQRLWEVVIFALALSGREQREHRLGQLQSFHAPPDLLLRIIRESQAYDLSIFRSATDLLTERLLVASSWDQNWFRIAQLLISTLIEAERSSVLAPGVVTVRTLLAQLTQGGSTKFKALFDVYLEMNPEEALALIAAQPTEAGILTSERLTQAMRQPELATIAIRKIVEQDDPNCVWATALAESALQYELVAKMMVDTEAPSTLRVVLERASAAHRWDLSDPVRGSVYGAVLNLATEASRPHVDVNTLISLIAQVPSSGTARFSRRMLGGYSRLPIAFLSAILSAFVVFAVLGSVLGVIISSPLSILLVALLFTAGRVGMRVSRYQNIPTNTVTLRRILLNLEHRNVHSGAPRLWLLSPLDKPLLLSQGYMSSTPQVVVKIKRNGAPGRVHTSRRGARSFTALTSLSKLEQVAVIVDGRTTLAPLGDRSEIHFAYTWGDFFSRFFSVYSSR